MISGLFGFHRGACACIVHLPTMILIVVWDDQRHPWCVGVKSLNRSNGGVKRVPIISLHPRNEIPVWALLQNNWFPVALGGRL